MWLPNLIGVLFFPWKLQNVRQTLSVKQEERRADHEKVEILFMRQEILVAGKREETS